MKKMNGIMNMMKKVIFFFNIEWYSKGDTQAKDYKSEIWLPVERKKK